MSRFFIDRFGLSIEHVSMVSSKNSTVDPVIDISEFKRHLKPTVESFMSYKDRSSTSDANYQTLRNLVPTLPSKYSLVNFRAKLGKEIDISNNKMGFYFNCEQKVTMEVKRRFDFLNDKTNLRLRIAGDGTQVNKVSKLKNFNFTFTILNDPACISADQTHTLGYYEVEKEDNVSLAVCLKEVEEELSCLRNVKINDQSLSIEYRGGGDMVYIANALGVNSNFNNALCPCVFCKRPRSSFGDTTRCWPIIGKGARSLAEAFQSYQDGVDGYVCKPVIRFIEPFNYVPDIMHLMMNVTKKLVELLFDELIIKDSYLTNNTKELSKLIDVNKLNTFLRASCKINNGIHPSKHGFELSTSVSAKQYYQVLTKMTIAEFNLHDDRKCLIQKVWRSFSEVVLFIKNNNNDHVELQARTRLFILSFLDTYHDTDVTPYMHITSDHLHQLMELHGNLNIFNCEGLEKANSINTRCYHRASNKHSNVANGEDKTSVGESDHYLVQVLKAKHRLASVVYPRTLARSQPPTKRTRVEDKQNGISNSTSSNILPSITGSVIDPIDKSNDKKDDEVIFVDQQISNDSHILHINIDSVLLNGSEWLTNLNMIYASRLLQAQFKGYNIMEEVLSFCTKL